MHVITTRQRVERLLETVEAVHRTSGPQLRIDRYGIGEHFRGRRVVLDRVHGRQFSHDASSDFQFLEPDGLLGAVHHGLFHGAAAVLTHRVANDAHGWGVIVQLEHVGREAEAEGIALARVGLNDHSERGTPLPMAAANVAAPVLLVPGTVVVPSGEVQSRSAHLARTRTAGRRHARRSPPTTAPSNQRARRARRLLRARRWQVLAPRAGSHRRVSVAASASRPGSPVRRSAVHPTSGWAPPDDQDDRPPQRVLEGGIPGFRSVLGDSGLDPSRESTHLHAMLRLGAARQSAARLDRRWHVPQAMRERGAA